MRDLMNRVYHSMENTKTPMIIACISMALNIVLNLILRGVMGVNGLAFATSVAALIGCILLARGITQRIGRVFNRKFVLELAKIAFSSALAAGRVAVHVAPAAGLAWHTAGHRLADSRGAARRCRVHSELSRAEREAVRAHSFHSEAILTGGHTNHG